MKNMKSKIAAIALSLVMVFAFSGCSAAIDDMIDFIKNGWDGIYEITARAEYVAPDPTVRTNDIRENHKVTKVNNKVTENHKVTGTKHVVGEKNTDSDIAQTDFAD